MHDAIQTILRDGGFIIWALLALAVVIYTLVAAVWWHCTQLRQRIRAGRARGHGAIFVVYGDCGTGGGLDRVCAEEGVERVPGPHCYSFFDGNDAFAARAEAGEITAFYLTDFLARQFDTLVWRGMGLDRHPELLPMLFGHYERLIYLAQADDPAVEARARAAAARLGLVYERRFTGYGDLAGFLGRAARA